MTDLDLYLALREKTAGPSLNAVKAQVKDEASKLLQRLAQNKGKLLAAGIGGAVGTGAGYAISKRWNADKPSRFEREADAALRAHQSSEQEKRREGKPFGFTHRMGGVAAKTLKNLAEVGRHHPIRTGALIGTGAGMTTGKLVHLVVQDIQKRIARGELK